MYVRGTCGLPPTKNENETYGGGSSRARVFVFVYSVRTRIADAADADRYRRVLLCLVCGVGLALATHARKLARTHCIDYDGRREAGEGTELKGCQVGVVPDRATFSSCFSFIFHP